MADYRDGSSGGGETGGTSVSALSYLFQDLIDNVGVAIYLAQDGRFVFVNSDFEELSGYSITELIGHNAPDLVHPDDREMVRERAINALKTYNRRTPSYEYRLVKKGGGIMWVIERVASIEYRGRRAVLGNFMDITQRKLLESALHKSEERYRNVLQQMEEPYFERDLEGHYTFANDAMCAVAGYPREELVGMHFSMILPPEEQEKVMAIQKNVYETGKAGRTPLYRIIRKDGSIRYVETSVTLLRDESGAVSGYSCVARDFTEQKQLIDALARSEERYRSTLDRLQDSYLEVDLKGNFTYVNSTFCSSLGLSEAEIIGKNYREIMPASEIENTFKAYNEVFRTGTPNPRYQHILMRKNGETFFVEASIDLLRDSNGDIIGFRALIRDITERKRLEEELRRSEEKYRTILREIEDAYYETDLEGNFTFVNRAFARDLRYSEEELIGMHFRQVVPAEDVTDVYNHFNQTFRTGESSRGFSHRILCKDGAIGYVEASISLIRNPQGKVIGFRAINRDITEHRKLEQKLVEMATHDYLTGLPNRMLLSDRFSVAVAHANRSGSKLAVLSLDMDSLKAVNDALGHGAGDELLRMVAIRLSDSLRASDTVARIGGDEFVLLLEGIHDFPDAIVITEKVMDSFNDPFLVEGHCINISASIGISIYPDDGADLDALMHKSDAAMYYSKRAGGNRYKLFTDSDRQGMEG